MIKDIRGDTLRAVVHFLYSGTIEITVDNAESLLAAASFFLSSQLQKKCTDFFTEPGVIDTHNCVGIWKVAFHYVFRDLELAAAEVLFENIIEVSKTDDFLRLSSTEMTKILDNDAIDVDSEEDVFNALVNWIEFDINERRTLFPDLVRAVRVNHLKESVSLRVLV